MKLIPPIQNRFTWDGNVMMVNQFFGENPGMTVDGVRFYGPEGHPGVDLSTILDYKFEPYYLNDKNADGKFDNTEGNYKKVSREPSEAAGHIPTVATHAGALKTNFFTSNEQRGYGVSVTSDVLQEDGKAVQYQSLHWHLISPWQSLMIYSKTVTVAFREKQVVPGEVIGMCGNTGMSTGPHLHYEMKKRWMNDGKWSDWTLINPMPMFRNPNIIFHRWYGGPNHEFWYEGEKVTEEKAKEIIKSLPQLV